MAKFIVVVVKRRNNNIEDNSRSSMLGCLHLKQAIDESSILQSLTNLPNSLSFDQEYSQNDVAEFNS